MLNHISSTFPSTRNIFTVSEIGDVTLLRMILSVPYCALLCNVLSKQRVGVSELNGSSSFGMGLSASSQP